jgi:hypothetical protein
MRQKCEDLLVQYTTFTSYSEVTAGQQHFNEDEMLDDNSSSMKRPSRRGKLSNSLISYHLFFMELKARIWF